MRIWTHGLAPTLERRISTQEAVSPVSLTKKGRLELYHHSTQRNLKRHLNKRVRWNKPQLGRYIKELTWNARLQWDDFAFICWFIDRISELWWISKDFYFSNQFSFNKCAVFAIKGHYVKKKQQKKTYVTTPKALILQSLFWTWHNLELYPQCSHCSQRAQNLSCQTSPKLIKAHLSLSVTCSQEPVHARLLCLTATLNKASFQEKREPMLWNALYLRELCNFSS